MNVSPAAALNGSYGLQAVINDNNSIYVTDNTPNAEPRYRARFYFDPNSIVMADKDAHYIFYGGSDAATPVLRVEFRKFKGSYQLRAVPAGTAPANRSANVLVNIASVALAGASGRTFVVADKAAGGSPPTAFVLSDQ